MELCFESGTLVLNDPPDELPDVVRKAFTPDPRTGNLRARSCDYAETVLALRKAGIDVVDHARDFKSLDELKLQIPIVPRPHQTEALTAWQSNAYRGVAALPTGSGKTILAVLAIARLKRSSLVLVPTIDLLIQWTRELEKYFGGEIGMLGGGEHRICDITVSTYDSAVIHMEFIGNQFGFLIADECHHLPGPETRLAALMCIAPYRLGLSATPELPAERAAVLADLMGPTVCEIQIDELAGAVLSPYRVETLRIELTPEDAECYCAARKIYTDFLWANGINFRNPSDWGRFLGLCARTAHGHEVFQAFLEQRRISRSGKAKLEKVRELLELHSDEQVIVFTADNATAYLLGRKMRLPVITHHTKPAERKDFLDLFRKKRYRTLITSKVLNEGVDVPSVGVGIILSGSGSVREHVQRLGRILRAAPGKEQAVLYELISAGTGEEAVSQRRRDHRAYRKFSR